MIKLENYWLHILWLVTCTLLCNNFHFYNHVVKISALDFVWPRFLIRSWRSFLVGERLISLSSCTSEICIKNFNVFWCVALFWRWLFSQDSWHRKKIWIYDNRYILARSTFKSVSHAEEAVVWVVNYFSPNSFDLSFITLFSPQYHPANEQSKNISIRIQIYYTCFLNHAPASMHRELLTITDAFTLVIACYRFFGILYFH